MQKIKVGQRVHVEYDGVVTRTWNDRIHVQGPDDNTHVYHEGVPITPAKPVSWPPQAGDIWKAGPREWVTVLHHDAKLAMWPVYDVDLGETYGLTGGSDTDLFLALNPVLVRRRDQLVSERR